VDSRRIADQDEAAGACYANGMPRGYDPHGRPESPRFRELGNSRRIRTWDNVPEQVNFTKRVSGELTRWSVGFPKLKGKLIGAGLT
jgi:hypothetical protein